MKIYKEVSSGAYPDDVEEYSIAKPWADIKSMQGKEFSGAGTILNETPIRFMIRYREGITSKNNVKYQNKTYNIKSVTNDNGRNETLTIFAVSTE
ncbi:phage head closure protein [Staphylococcus xylosus]|uniref:phage head closure protein n=1 Tax=Staphylococcus xylosus TaxID=1288 RepID=UPI001C3E98A9